jgi:hypothetical protein
MPCPQDRWKRSGSDFDPGSLAPLQADRSDRPHFPDVEPLETDVRREVSEPIGSMDAGLNIIGDETQL